MKKKFAWAVTALSVAAVAATALTACGLFPSLGSDQTFPSSVATQEGDYGSPESFLASQDTPATHERQLYDEAVADGSFTGTFYEFLQALGAEEQDPTYGIQYAVNSVVAVETDTSLGSGVIFDLDRAAGDAYIVTNYHVVAETSRMGMTISDSIEVYLYGGEVASRGISASYVGGAMEYDIAVLRVEDSVVLRESSAQEAVGADSDSVTAGQAVYAIGNADGVGISVTSGVISVETEYAYVESADGAGTVRLLCMRTDAATNHGNSGGGLFDARGRLVGIVSARSEQEGVVGFSYAIHSNLALALAQNICDNASERGVVRAYFGISTLTADSHGVYDEDTGKTYIEEQVVVGSVATGSVAARAGLDVGDTVLSAAIVRSGQTVRSVSVTRMHKLTNLLICVRLGDRVELTVSRNGQTVRLTAEFAKTTDFILLQ